jgi:hypothetical protein
MEGGQGGSLPLSETRDPLEGGNDKVAALGLHREEGERGHGKLEGER